MTGFVTSEVAAHGAKIDPDAAAFLVQAVGSDLRSLAAAADQLTNDFPGEQLTVEKVQRYFGGRAEAKSFAVADAAFAGKRALALEELRWALDGGTAVGAGDLRDGGLGAQPGPLPRLPARGAATATWPATSASRRGRCARSATSPARGAPTGSPPRCGRWPWPTPTSRARPTTRPTPSSGWSSPSPACATPLRPSTGWS